MEYTNFECKTCLREFILVKSELESSLRLGKYISCSYCNSRKVSKQREADSIKECMKERKYIRNKHGALVQK